MNINRISRSVQKRFNKQARKEALKKARNEAKSEVAGKVRKVAGNLPKSGDANFIGPKTKVNYDRDFIGPKRGRGPKSENLSKDWGEFGRTAWDGIVENTISKEGLDRLVGNTVTGAMWGAGIGGTTEAAQGGSFWEGAKSGAFRGGLYYGVGGSVLGSAARGFDPKAEGFKKGYDTMSKQLKAVVDNQKAARLAKQATGTK